MNLKSSSWMKCQYHHHSLPMQIPSSNSFNYFPSYNYSSPAFVGKQTPMIHLHLSSKNEYWAMKSKKNEEQQITAAAAAAEAIIIEKADDDDDDEEELKRKRRIIRIVTGAAATIGAGVILMGQEKAAWALGPEGPMVEEFWENVRRYGLYALTVSTGVLYAVLQPIVELLKNPISALLVILIFGGSFFLLSQILSAMFGVSDFAYQYAS